MSDTISVNTNQSVSVYMELGNYHIILAVGDKPGRGLSWDGLIWKPSRVEVFSLNETRESLIPKVRRMGRHSVVTCLSKWGSIAKATIASPVTFTRKALALNGSIRIVHS